MRMTPMNREYVRTGNWSVTAKVGKDDTELWDEVPVLDIAAGGILFLSDTPYVIGDKLWFSLKIDPMAPGIPRKISIKVKGKIVGDRGIRDGKHTFSVKFTEISSCDRIRIDELVRMTSSHNLDGYIDPLDV